jgi:hypothetical protein
MSSHSRRRTLPLATALLALVLSAPAAPVIAAGNTSAEPSAPNFPTAVPTRPGALTQAADTVLPGPPTWPANPRPITRSRAVVHAEAKTWTPTETQIRSARAQERYYMSFGHH